MDPELLEEQAELEAGGRGHVAAPKARIGALYGLEDLDVRWRGVSTEEPEALRAEIDETRNAIDNVVAEIERLKGQLETELTQAALHAVSGEQVDVSELFGGGSFVEAATATALNMTPGAAYDLRTGFNLSKPATRAKVWADLERQKPQLVVGSPMCAAFSTLAAMQDTSSQAYKV